MNAEVRARNAKRVKLASFGFMAIGVIAEMGGNEIGGAMLLLGFFGFVAGRFME